MSDRAQQEDPGLERGRHRDGSDGWRSWRAGIGGQFRYQLESLTLGAAGLAGMAALGGIGALIASLIGQQPDPWFWGGVAVAGCLMVIVLLVTVVGTLTRPAESGRIGRRVSRWLPSVGRSRPRRSS